MRYRGKMRYQGTFQQADVAPITQMNNDQKR